MVVSDGGYPHEEVMSKSLKELEPRSGVTKSPPTLNGSSPPRPRIVGAALKSYRDIPEELFNSLPESSVDPSPSECNSPEKKNATNAKQDWVVMQEARRALLQDSVLHDSEDDTDSVGPDSCNQEGRLQDTTDASDSIRQHFRGFCTTMMEGTRLNSSIISPSDSQEKIESPNHNTHSLNDSSCTESRIGLDLTSETEKELRAAGVYFRLPSDSFCSSHNQSSSSNNDVQYLSSKNVSKSIFEKSSDDVHDQSCDSGEVAAVLNGLDVALAHHTSQNNLSSSSSNSSFAHNSYGDSESFSSAAVNSQVSGAPPLEVGREKSLQLSAVLRTENSALSSVSDPASAVTQAGRSSSVLAKDVRNATGARSVWKNLWRNTSSGGNMQCEIRTLDTDTESKTSVAGEKVDLEYWETSSGAKGIEVQESKGGKISAVKKGDCSDTVVTICPYTERAKAQSYKTDLISGKRRPNTSVLLNNVRNKSLSHNISITSRDSSSVMEPLNLIEEVIVPESSVAMKAFFTGVEYSSSKVSDNCPSKPSTFKGSQKSDRGRSTRSGDSDSGHGSGTTSPCGTLTDPPSPPPSPPDIRLISTSHHPPKPPETRLISTSNYPPTPPDNIKISSTHRSPSSLQQHEFLNQYDAETRKSSQTVTNSVDDSSSPDDTEVSVIVCPGTPHNGSDESGIPGHQTLEPSQITVDGCPISNTNRCCSSSTDGPCHNAQFTVACSDEVTVTCGGDSEEFCPVVVVAIDFGTTYSGYAFSFFSDPRNVHIMKKWEGGDPGVVNQKTPTIVLLTPDGDFHSVGYTARDHYHDLDPREAARWLYFEKFKMELHDDKTLNRDTLLTSANGVQVPALEVFSHVLRYFRDLALRELNDLVPCDLRDDLSPEEGVTLSAVRWVITVPAIWSHPAKQFMRTAAYKACLASPLRSDQLLIALEPEAAAIHCRSLHAPNLRSPSMGSLNGPLQRPASVCCSPYGGTLGRNRDPNEDTRSPPADGRPWSTIGRPSVSQEGEDEGDGGAPLYRIGQDHSGSTRSIADWLAQDTVYMVVDCGGGTVDITVHQMTDLKAGHLRELHKATGGPYGSVGVDREFEKLMDQIFGAEFMATFKQQRPAAYVDLMIAFESRKRSASTQRSTPLNIALPFSFIDMYKKTKGKDVAAAIRKHGTAVGVEWSSQGMLRVSHATMKSLFTPTLNNIQQCIEAVLGLVEREASTGGPGLQLLFLVGGFSESDLLQQHIKQAFSNRLTVVIPQGMSLAILRGAVQFGLDPSVVTVRRSRLTYGVGVLNRYQEGVHPQEKRVYAAGAEWCADVLDVFVRVDESVAVGDVVSRSYTPATAGQATVVLHLYATHDTKPMHFVSDLGVQRVGSLLLDLRDTWTKDEGSCQRCTTSLNDKDPRPNDGSEQAEPKPCTCCSKTGGDGEGTSNGSKRREISVHMKFGDTEVKASAVDHSTGKCVKANFDFLSL